MGYSQRIVIIGPGFGHGRGGEGQSEAVLSGPKERWERTADPPSTSFATQAGQEERGGVNGTTKPARISGLRVTIMPMS